MSPSFRAALWIFIMLILGTAAIIVGTAMEHPPRELREGTWTPPAIEQCDKETWDRIREGCDGQEEGNTDSTGM